MKPDPEVLAALQAALDPRWGQLRLSIGQGGAWMMTPEGGDPATALGLMAGLPGDAEGRIEAMQPDGQFATVIPYFRLAQTMADDVIEVTGPGDPNGLPVRLMVYDDLMREYVADFAQFGDLHRLDAAALPMSHLLRTRFYRWNPAGFTWQAVGYSRRLPGSGKLGRPAPGPRHLERAVPLARRVRELIGPGEEDGGLIEFFDDADFLADVPLTAPDTELQAELATLLAGSPELALRVRLVEYAPNDSKRPGPLMEITDIKPAFDGLLRYLKGFDNAADEARRLLDLTSGDDGSALGAIVSGYLFKFLPEGIGVGPQDWRLGPIDGLCADWDALEDGSLLVGELLNYIWLYALMQRHAAATSQTFASFFSPEHLTDGIEPILAAMDAMPAGRAGFYSSIIYRAKLESLRDRDRAEALFAQALTSASPMRPIATFDGGADTYFSAAFLDAKAADIDARRDALMSSLQLLDPPPPARKEPVFLFSTDPRFMAIYLPGWLAQADYCKARNLDFHFIVIGEEQAVTQALAKAETLRLALADLRGVDAATYADNVSYSMWRVPDWCPEPITFYACARYLALGEVTRRLGRDVLIQDMDFTLLEDPQAFLANFPQPGFGIQASNGLYGIDAWRRFMGGTFFATDSEDARHALRHLEAYLIEGLARERSWYLDQNALSYFFERARAEGRDFWSLKLARPTQQPKVNQLFEAVQPLLGGA